MERKSFINRYGIFISFVVFLILWNVVTAFLR